MKLQKLQKLQKNVVMATALIAVMMTSVPLAGYASSANDPATSSGRIAVIGGGSNDDSDLDGVMSSIGGSGTTVEDPMATPEVSRDPDSLPKKSVSSPAHLEYGDVTEEQIQGSILEPADSRPKNVKLITIGSASNATARLAYADLGSRITVKTGSEYFASADLGGSGRHATVSSNDGLPRTYRFGGCALLDENQRLKEHFAPKWTALNDGRIYANVTFNLDDMDSLWVLLHSETGEVGWVKLENTSLNVRLLSSPVKPAQVDPDPEDKPVDPEPADTEPVNPDHNPEP